MNHRATQLKKMKVTMPARLTILAAYSFILLAYLSINLSWAGETKRVSVASNGVQGNSLSNKPSLSANGRWVAFHSIASNLVTGDTNKSYDIFLRDRLTNKTNRISVASNRAQANAASLNPSLSADGRWVAFQSTASNLVAGDTNNYQDIFLHDRQTKITTRVSVASNGAQGNHDSYAPSLSADGHWIAFQSTANNLAPGDTNNSQDIFLHDRLTKITTRVSVASNGMQGNSVSWDSILSADGRWVAFYSYADNLVLKDTNRTYDIFLHNRLTKTTTRVSVASNGAQGNGASSSPGLSADGRWVVFESYASNLVTGDTNSREDIFLHDRVTKTTTRLSISSKLAQANNSSYSPNISADGQWVAFRSDASNLVTGDSNNRSDIFLYDRLTKTTTRASITSNGAQGNNVSQYPKLSSTGRWVAFESIASNLVTGDTNSVSDIFIRDRWLDTTFQGDLAVITVQQPTSLTAGGAGHYVFKITNYGPHNIKSVQLTHLISNGQIIALSPTQGICKSYATITLCSLLNLSPGQSLTLSADIKAFRNSLNQQLSVFSNARADQNQTNNYLYVKTLVTP